MTPPVPPAPRQNEPAPDKPADEQPVVPTRSRDDSDEGWGERARGNDDRLYEDRPPHWGSD